MSDVVFEASGERRRVGKILCLGRNYAAHAREMGGDIPESPVIFLKPASAIIHGGDNVVLPRMSCEVHHEVEMVVVMGKRARNVRREDAYSFVDGYAVGLDMTLRDIQTEARKKGEPWTVAKGFDTSAPISGVVEGKKVTDPHILDLSLKVNGETRQHSNTSRMIFKVDFLVSYLSGIFTLEPGDLIFTGTPEGVGPVHAGDVVEAGLETVGTLRVGVIGEPALVGT